MDENIKRNVELREKLISAWTKRFNPRLRYKDYLQQFESANKAFENYKKRIKDRESRET